jgi:hypothetical protein
MRLGKWLAGVAAGLTVAILSGLLPDLGCSHPMTARVSLDSLWRDSCAVVPSTYSIEVRARADTGGTWTEWAKDSRSGTDDFANGAYSTSQAGKTPMALETGSFILPNASGVDIEVISHQIGNHGDQKSTAAPYHVQWQDIQNAISGPTPSNEVTTGVLDLRPNVHYCDLSCRLRLRLSTSRIAAR